MKKFNQPFKRPSSSPVTWEVNSFLMIIISVVLPFFNNRRPVFQFIKAKRSAVNGNYRFKSKPHLFLFVVLGFLSLTTSAQEISATNTAVADENKIYGVSANSFQATFTSLSFPEGNKLEWVPVVNCKKEFEVQRRLENETDFSTIDIVESKGNTSAPVAYSYFDTDVSGAAYYRLKSVDATSTHYSSVVYANRKSVTLPINVVLYPNPVNTSSLQLDFKEAIAGKVDIKLFNLSGKQMPVGVQQSNDFLCSINVTEILKGAYTVQVKQGKRIYKQRIMIK